MSSVTQAQDGRGPGRALSLSRCALLVTSGEQQGQERVLDGDLLRIGKNPDNDLVLTDTTVSREHCEIVRDEKGYLLRDLGSTNGTLLEGAEVREGYLRPGGVITVGRIELRVRTYAERIELVPSAHERFGELFGTDSKMREIFGLLERISATDATLLIGGETGTGKDVLARSVHAASKRKQGPFLAVDCGALVASLIESELFGHEKGAFTGANERRLGAFELAHRGTLFLDEVGELPLSLQPALLRALETRRIRRVGGGSEIPVDIRVIAASNRNLLLEVERGKFRKDLYFRLAVVPIDLPPLRERRGDIAALASHLLASMCKEHFGSAVARSLSPASLHALSAHDWPGNVRELRNVLERALLFGKEDGGAQVEPSALGLGVAIAAEPASSGEATIGAAPALDPAQSYRENRARFEADFERRYVRWLLDRHAGNVSAAAREAGMDRKYLHKLAVKHGAR
ncbi:MAG: sigma 54-interacting transcriptional regulator [Polyangiales bacterium]